MMKEIPYLLRNSTIAHLKDNALYIGDRRLFPFERTFVRCESVREIAAALSAMVTQGGGPLEVALQTMRFVRLEIQQGRLPATLASFFDARDLLAAARPTNTTMARALDALLGQYVSIEEAMERVDEDVSAALAHWEAIYRQMGKLGSSLLTDKSAVLTTCFAEHSLLYTLQYAQADNKAISLYVNETRPYLQGSRLTAPSAAELGIPVTVIGDGMGATLLREGSIDCYMTACDVLCMDGTVVNKTGTLANAIAASYYGIPYYPFSISPDPTKGGVADLVMEERDPQEMKECRGIPTTTSEVAGRYPAFDIIEPSLVTSVVTPKGILTPKEVKEHFL